MSSDTNSTIRRLPSSAQTEIERIWKQLDAEHGDGGLTTSWAWISTWLAVFGPRVPHEVLVGERDGVPYGIALLTTGVKQRLGPLPIRTVHLGTAGEPPLGTVVVEYNRLLVAEGERVAFSRAVFDALQRRAGWFAEVTFSGFAPEDVEPFLTLGRGRFVRREPCPTADLAAIRATGGDVIASLGKNTRASIRRSIRTLGDVRLEWCSTAPQAESILTELIELHQRRWQEAGQPGVFGNPPFLRFHRMLIPQLLADGRLFLVRVTAGERTVGCLYGFIERGQVLFYQSGFMAAMDKVNPGLVAHAVAMQACLERGLDAYNFLQGDSRYKRQLATTERELVWAVASRGVLWPTLLNAARRRKYATTMAPAGASD